MKNVGMCQSVMFEGTWLLSLDIFKNMKAWRSEKIFTKLEDNSFKNRDTDNFIFVACNASVVETL